MAKITTLKTDSRDAHELEQEFLEKMDALIGEYYQQGMTAAWQIGVLTFVINSLMNTE